MSQGPLCPNLTQKVQKEVSQMANHNFSLAMLLGGLSVNLNHLIITSRRTPPCSFKRQSDTTLKEHEQKINFNSDCSPVVNQSSKPNAVNQEGTEAADDLDIEAYACIQYPIYLSIYLSIYL